MGNTDDIQDEGRIAAAQGLKRSDNPYDEDTDEHGEWETGFDHYEDVDEDGEMKEG